MTILDGSSHQVDSSELAFQIAGSMAVKEGFSKARSVVLEPIMELEVIAPESYMGEVIGNLASKSLARRLPRPSSPAPFGSGPPTPSTRTSSTLSPRRNTYHASSCHV